MGKKEYFVQARFEDGIVISDMKTGERIVQILLENEGFYHVEMKVWDTADFGHLVPLELYGPWHDLDNPLHIKATRPDGSIAFEGYGNENGGLDVYKEGRR